MNNKKPALFIGRFQPFHLGHFDALDQIFEKEDYVIIGIGSTENDYVAENPFTAGERYQMIETAILGERLGGKLITRANFAIVPVRNIHHYSLWVKHVESILPPFERVYSGSAMVKRLFEAEKAHKVISVKKRRKISATEIRKLMLTGKKWGNLVPKKVAGLIKKWDGVNRLREIQPIYK